jgi:catechol 2,3-dioxygenase-like lactoylglutathione lyase family enzyme
VTHSQPVKIAFSLIAGLAIWAGAARPLAAEEAAAAPRPHILGIAHVALYVHDIARSRAFYEDFLGFAEPFALNNPDGSLRLAWVKVNDLQSIGLFPEKEPGSDRLYQLSFQVDDAEAMRRYLAAKGIAVPAKLSLGQSGTTQFVVHDPDGHTLEFVQFLPDSWIVRDTGQHLPDTRISTRIPHAGVMIHRLAPALAFYRDVLGFQETWRGSKDGAKLSWVNLKVPDGRDYVEFMLYDTMPAPARRGTLHHICLEVPDCAAAGEILKGRPMPQESKPSTKLAIGVNGKRQINYYDPDGTRVEVMEPVTADGKPRPPSSAPPPGEGG